ncbi:hypothetical protein [Anabaena catenula]|uniref:DUF998 domain-containing protein n=1 Tax=Anabaena catenula FACHB-362 TaxID=2692877 RepID=A0ABR8J5Y0_9NOST|nr:hypothetical protein [Anabaena catenula]MBD2693782.1 hypothetical protein [Anabaena catenula FACHB-362]
MLKKNIIAFDYYRQIRLLILIILATVIPFTLFITIGMLATNLSATTFVRDPLATAKLPGYIGLFSNVGILAWCSCVTVCFGTCLILKKKATFRKYADFLLWSGILTLVLMIDDLFMLHETLYDSFRIHEYSIYIIYLIMTVRIIIKCSRLIEKTEFIILSAAILFFGLSLFADTFFGDKLISVEDSFKFLGIICWATYFIRLSWQQIQLFFENANELLLS